MTFLNWLGLLGSYVLATTPFLLFWYFLGIRWSFMPPKVWIVEIKPKTRSYLNYLAERYRKQDAWFDKSIFSKPSDISGISNVFSDDEIDQGKILRWSLKLYLMLIVPCTAWQVFNISHYFL